MSARRAAADLVIAVLENGRALEDALETSKHFTELEGRDRAFARAIASTTLRHLGSIDAALARFLQRPLPERADAARALLRTGAAQLLFLETPPHAAVSETVAIANAHRGLASFAGLMNAVLRKVAAEGRGIVDGLPAGADLPPWLYARWRAAYGDAPAAAISQALQQEAPLDLTARNDAGAVATSLEAELLPTNSVRVQRPFPLAGEGREGGRSTAADFAEFESPPPRAEHGSARPSPPGGGLEQLPGFAEGAFWVQDAAAALPAKLLRNIAGQRVLDLCAAPGGKTLQLAAAGARVTALDRDEHRLDRLRASLQRTHLEAEIVCADALEWSAPEPFDAVLLDAPCTSTGTIRRHPDLPWLRRPSDIQSLAALQARLLARAESFVRSGGQLVYAVCSLEPEEGPAIIANAGDAWTLDPITAAEIPEEFIADGALRTLPSHWSERGGIDGFFAARLIRR